MREARRKSLEPDAAQIANKTVLIAIVDSRLAVFGRRRESTPSDGNCQFIAVARGLGFGDEKHLELRREVVSYLKTQI